MTRKDIEHMVREAGIKTGFVLRMPEWDKATWLFMRRFAALVAAAEREKCAHVCLDQANAPPGEGREMALFCAAAIRARSTTN